MRIDVYGHFWYVFPKVDIAYYRYNGCYMKVEAPAQHRINFVLEFYE